MGAGGERCVLLRDAASDVVAAQVPLLSLVDGEVAAALAADDAALADEPALRGQATALREVR